MYDGVMAIVVEAPKPELRLTAAIERRLRIIFFGTPLFAVPSLRRLQSDGWPVCAVITAPDKPVGRRMLMTASPVKSTAAELQLPVLTPATLKDDAVWAEFENLKPDLCIVVAYGKLIPERFLTVPRLGFLNIHPSLLPAYRGPSPIATALLEGATATGVSIMQLDTLMDHGPVLASKSWAIPTGFDTPLCEDELSRLGADLLCDILPAYVRGALPAIAQDEHHVTLTRKFDRTDGLIDWSDYARAIHNRVRALSANPGTWTLWSGKTLNILHAHSFDGPLTDAPPGTVVLLGRDIVVHCGTGGLALETVQLEGAERMNTRDFINGRPTFIGARLGT